MSLNRCVQGKWYRPRQMAQLPGSLPPRERPRALGLRSHLGPREGRSRGEAEAEVGCSFREDQPLQALQTRIPIPGQRDSLVARPRSQGNA